jgi:hypothetical protein
MLNATGDSRCRVIDSKCSRALEKGADFVLSLYAAGID